jgi:predicted ATPase
MRLTKSTRKNYRSVEDSQEFEVDGVTCLIGKNEAGKTALSYL